MKKIIVILAVFLFAIVWNTAGAADVKIEEVKPLKVLLIKGKSNPESIGPDMKKMFGELFGYLGEKKITPTGPPMSIYYSPPIQHWEVAVAVPVAENTPGTDRIKYMDLAGGKMASMTVTGPYEKLRNAWREFMDWMAKSGHIPGGPARAVYLKSAPEVKPDEFVTLLLWPVIQ